MPHSYETFVLQLIIYFQECSQATGVGKLGDCEISPTTTYSEDCLSDIADFDRTDSEFCLLKLLYSTDSDSTDSRSTGFDSTDSNSTDSHGTDSSSTESSSSDTSSSSDSSSTDSEYSL